jgi:hypothetical protein
VDTSDDGYAEREQQNEWDQPTTDEEPTEPGCLETIATSGESVVLPIVIPHT